MTTLLGKRVLIVGAGLAGSLLAIALARRGCKVHVHERRPDPRAKGYIGGRSINLALSCRGIDALAWLGLDQHVLQRDAIAMRGRMMHAPGGQLTFQPYSSDTRDAINSVSRGGLNLTLINAAAAEPGVTMVFDSMCTDCDLNAPAATFRSADGVTTRVEADLIASADGAFSAVRGVMTKTDRFDYSQSYLSHAYKELHIHPRPVLRERFGIDAPDWQSEQLGGPVASDLDPKLFALQPHALHIWPRGGAMMIALPNRDGSFTCTLFWPFKGEHSFQGLPGHDAQAVRAFFMQHYADAVRLMPELLNDYAQNPTSSLVTVRCFPWQHAGKVILLGDAAHAIVPFYGQGMNASFEDVKCLTLCLERYATDQHTALEEFQSLRKPNAEAIADMAIDNLTEMRDKVGQPAFLYRKRVEQVLHASFPASVHPQYNLVSFSTVPYAEARQRGRELDAVLDRVIERVPMPMGFPGTQPAAQWQDAVIGVFRTLSGASR